MEKKKKGRPESSGLTRQVLTEKTSESRILSWKNSFRNEREITISSDE